jgi:3D (Asp-Asp-Asp) domain-containing protein
VLSCLSIAVKASRHLNDIMTKNSKKIQLMRERMKTILSLGLLVAVTMVSMPVQTASADAADTTTVLQAFLGLNDESEYHFSVPSYTKVTVVREYRYVPMTAYTSRPEETDSTPFITADGSHVRDGIVACNFLPFGTKVRIPTLFGDKIFEVHDRMNKRFPYKMDFWMEDYGEAIRFGVKYAHIEVVETEDVNG